MGWPPLSSGGSHEIVSLPSPCFAMTLVGGPGLVFAPGVPVTAADGGPSPALFSAVMVIVYCTPGRTKRVLYSFTDVVTVPEWADEVYMTVYCVIGAPLFAGSSHDIFSAPLPGTTMTLEGAPGGPAGVADAPSDSLSVLSVYFATTVQVYLWPFDSKSTTLLRSAAAALFVVVPPPAWHSTSKTRMLRPS